MITQIELKELLDYDPNTGIFRWKKTTSYKKLNGQIAGYNNGRGYYRISINNKKYMAHRLAWLYMTGNWPNEYIDHINGIGTDNRFCNLRQATQKENLQNARIRNDNTSGYTGVYWFQSRNKWVSKIWFNGKSIHLGYFDDPAIAYQAYLDAKQKYHKFNPVPR